MNQMVRTISSSAAKLSQRCMREYSYGYVDCIESVRKSAALDLGTLTHSGLEALWKGESLDEAIRSIQLLVTEYTDPYDVVRAEEMVRVYDERWPRPYTHGEKLLKVIGVEK